MSAEIIWKIAKILVPVIIGAIIGGIVVGKAKQLQIDAVKLELAKTKQELTVCQDANQASQATIGSITTELQSAQKSCTTRLRQKENTAAEIKRIDSLKPGVKTDETDSNTVGSGSGDPILDGLNGMFINDGKPADRED
jgi:septal ring factor EnvC (AmiA/AmiB activator)